MALQCYFGHKETLPLSPQIKDFFSAGDLANIRFLRDGNGAVTGFMVSTGRVLNLKFTRIKP